MILSKISKNLLKSWPIKTHTRLLSYSPYEESLQKSLENLDNSSKLNFGIQIVPREEVRIVEKWGKFDRMLEPGFHFLVPFMHKVAYTHSLKERMIPIYAQNAWTKDNVQVSINGNVFVRVHGPMEASYNVETPYSMIYQMSFAAMRAEVGRLELDQLLDQREMINKHIADALRPRTENWGIVILGYEIQDINPQEEVLNDLTRQSRAERNRREAVNEAQGLKQSEILRSEAEMQAIQNKAYAEANAIGIKAKAEAKAIELVGSALINKEMGGPESAKFVIAKDMTEAWKILASKGPTVLLPANPSNISKAVAEAMSTMDAINKI